MRVYVDFDNTLVDSVTAFVNRYNQLYYRKIDPKTITDYNFSSMKLKDDELCRGFNSDFFFATLEPYEGAIKALTRMKQAGAELILVTRGTTTNISKKITWLDKHHVVKDLFTDFIFCTNESTKIDMKDSILIDDLRTNHLNSNARKKYAFKDSDVRGWLPIPDDGVLIYTKWSMIADDICNMLQPEVEPVKKTTPKKKTRYSNYNRKKKKGGD